MYFCRFCKLLYEDDCLICHQCNRPTSFSNGSQEEIKWFSENGFSPANAGKQGSNEMNSNSISRLNNSRDFTDLQFHNNTSKSFSSLMSEPNDDLNYNVFSIPEIENTSIRRLNNDLDYASQDYNGKEERTTIFERRSSFYSFLQSINWRVVAVTVAVITVLILVIVNFDVIVAYLSRLITRIIGTIIIIAFLVYLIRRLLSGRRRFF